MLPPSNGKMRRMGKKQQMRRQIASMAVGKENSAITIATSRTIEITKQTNRWPVVRLGVFPTHMKIMHHLTSTIQSKPDGFDVCPVRLRVFPPVTNPTRTVSRIQHARNSRLTRLLMLFVKFCFVEWQSAALLNTSCVRGTRGRHSRWSVRGSRCRRVLRNRNCRYRPCGSLRTTTTKNDYSCRSLRAAGTIG
jgi:hypothetical protein